MITSHYFFAGRSENGTLINMNYSIGVVPTRVFGVVCLGMHDLIGFKFVILLAWPQSFNTPKTLSGGLKSLSVSFNLCKDFSICPCNCEYAHSKHI